MSEFDDLYAEVIKPAKDEVAPVIPSKYDSPLKAGALAAARAITLGASDPLLRYGFNVAPETLEGLKEANPASSMVGEIGGIGLSLASGVGAPSAIAKAGLLAKGASTGVRGALRYGAAEGGLYGLSQYISDVGTEENPNLSAEKLFASVGGGMVGGAALGVAGHGFGKGLEAAKDMIASKLDGTSLREGLKKLAAKAYVRSVAQGSDYAHGKLDDAAEIGEFGLRNAKFSERADPYQMAEKFAAVKKQVGDERLGAVLDKVDEAAAAVGDTVASAGGTVSLGPKPVAGFDFRPAVARGRALIDDLRHDPAAKETVDSFDKLLNGYLEEQAAGPVSFRNAFKMQSNLRANLPKSGALSEKNALLNEWKEVLKDEIRNQAEALAPGAAPEIRAAMRDYRSAAELERLAGKKIARLEGQDGHGLEAAIAGGLIGQGPVGAGVGYVVNKMARQYGRGLSAHVLDKLADSAAVRAMGSGLKRFVDTAMESNPLWGGIFRAELELASARGAQNLLETHVKLAESDPSYLGTVGHADEDPSTLNAFAQRADQLEQAQQVLNAQDEQREKIFDRFLNGVSPRKDKDQISLKRYEGMAEMYNRAAADPDYLADLATPGPVARVAPDLTPYIAGVASRAAKYLQSTMPKPPELGSGLKALDRAWEPSPLQLSRWARCVEAVQNPNSVIEGIQDGSVTKEGVEALKVVYPELYADTQRALMERLATHKKLLSQAQRSAIAGFIRAPIGGAGERDKLLLMQNLYNTQRMQKPPVNGADGRQTVSQEENTQTQAQRIEGR